MGKKPASDPRQISLPRATKRPKPSKPPLTTPGGGISQEWEIEGKKDTTTTSTTTTARARACVERLAAFGFRGATAFIEQYGLELVEALLAEEPTWGERRSTARLLVWRAQGVANGDPWPSPPEEKPSREDQRRAELASREDRQSVY